MCRYWLAGIFFLFYGPSSWAATNYWGARCNYDVINAVSSVSGDLALAPVGSTVGTLTITVGLHYCVEAYWPNEKYSEVVLPAQPKSNYPNTCETTVPGIGLYSDSCVRNNQLFGPLITTYTLSSTDSVPRTKVFNYIKTGDIPPGLHALAPRNFSNLYEVVPIAERLVFEPIRPFLPPAPPEPIIVPTCSLVNSNISVDFGSVSSAGVQKPFFIEFGGCKNLADVVEFDEAVSLRFRSERINADGTALRNNVCSECSQGLQIALKSASGKPVKLSAAYKLANHESTEYGKKGIKYNFLAELQDMPGQKSSPGKIDAQLVFETIIE